ncbi:MAG: O-antigen ligase family protein [Bdellovibrionales bacterium]
MPFKIAKKALKHVQGLTLEEWGVAIFAVFLQIQVTIFADGDYLGLRLGLSDFLIPFAGLYILFSLLTKRSVWPCWSSPWLYGWLGALVIVMSIALLNGYMVNNELSNWAFYNKYLGFFILLAYFLLGGWITSNVIDKGRLLTIFMNVFTGFMILLMIASTVSLFIQFFASSHLWLSMYPWDGLAANRNAFMVLYVLAFSFVIFSYSKDEHFMPFWMQSLFWVFMPTFLIFNDSRTGWIASLLLLVILFCRHPLIKLKKIVLFLIVGIAIAVVPYMVKTNVNSYILNGMQMKYLLSAMNKQGGQLDYFGDQKRHLAVEDGLELYKQHNPIIGSGLGSYKPFQIEKRGEFIDVIDFTALWLLTETGALGLFMFAAFFVMCVYRLYLLSYKNKYNSSSFYRAIFTFLIIFALMSVLHELLYTRVLWFVAGLGLITVSSKQLNKNS